MDVSYTAKGVLSLSTELRNTAMVLELFKDFELPDRATFAGSATWNRSM